MVVVVKPTGLMVHRTNIYTDRVFLSELLLEQLGRSVWNVHRLDRATSGVLLCALDAETAGVLCSLRLYWSPLLNSFQWH